MSRANIELSARKNVSRSALERRAAIVKLTLLWRLWRSQLKRSVGPLLSRCGKIMRAGCVHAASDIARYGGRFLVWLPGFLASTGNGLRIGARHMVTAVHKLGGRRRPGVLAAVLAIVLLAGYLLYCVFTIPTAGGFAVEPTSALVLEADNGRVFGVRGVFKGEKLTAAELPPHLVRAVIAIEDRRFHEHAGIDLRGMLRAMWRNAWAGGAREGGSTISQQLARMMFLSPERTVRRKVQEILLALWLERHLGKEEILVRYLNTAYFGAGAYGIDAAAKRYFGKKAQDLNLAEAAMLAGLVRAPSQLAPHRNLEAARGRAELVLHAMVETGAVTADQAKPARAQPAVLRLPPEAPPGTNYFADMAGAEVKRLIGGVSADLALRTTIDLELQSAAERAVARRLDSEGRRKKVGQAALVAMTYDGAVVAMVGGRDYGESQFNRATQARRQPGSLFKVFVYLAVFQRGATPDTMMVDRPVQIGDWEPENYGGRHRGPVTLRTAFANSINTVAVQVADRVGIPAVIDSAKRLGIQSELPALPSLALGSAEVTLLEMTRAFAAIAANVSSVETYAVRSIRSNEQTLYNRPPAAPQKVSDPARAAMLDVLTSVIHEGTGKAARVNRPAAGKTGTSQEHRDAWFIGFTPELVVGVWVGNDDNTPTNKVTGGDMPAVIWRDFITQSAPVLARRSPPAQAFAPATEGRAPPGQPSSMSHIRGPALVVDTGTLEIQGKTIRLFGVEGEDGRVTRALARFLARRDVICEPRGNEGMHRCQVDGNDLSLIILLNGGARASADAPPELLAAEDRARATRLGIWRRSR